MMKNVKQRFSIGILLISSAVHAFELPQDHDIRPEKEVNTIVAYDASLYNLAYTTFLANGNLKSAFFLARKAVKEKPMSNKWIKRYAQVSAWLGYGDISMKQWIILVKRSKNPKVAKAAIKMANLTYDYPSLIKIYQYQLGLGVPMKTIATGLSKALMKMGEPEQALALLKKYKKSSDKGIIQLQHELGMLEPVLKNLQAIQRKKGLSTHNAIEQAEVLFTMGRAKQAFLILKQAAPHADSQNKKFWQLLAELSWKEDDMASALMSYDRLYALKEKSQVSLHRLGFLLRKSAPKKSLAIMLENWKKNPTINNLYQAVSSSFLQKNWPLFYNLFEQFPPKEKSIHAELYIQWALAQGLNELAIDAAANADKTGNPPPEWVTLALAMRNNDSVKINKYLMQMKSSKDIDNYGDLSGAAYQIGQIQSAQEFAYRGLEAQPDDSPMYQQLKNTLLPHANYLNLDVHMHQSGPISGFEKYTSSRYFIAPRFYIEPFLKLWHTHSNNKAQIINAPKVLRDIGTVLSLMYKKSLYSLKLAQRQAVRHFVQAEIAWEKQWSRSLRSTMRASYQHQADESTTLLIGGKKNLMEGGVTYQITARDSISASIVHNEFYAQDAVYLGEGQNYRFSWLHKLHFAYPDWNVNTYANLNQYTSTGNTSALVDNLLPFENTAGALPLNFYDVGITLGVGQVYREEYTHAFRPFTEIGLFWHSLNGLGQIATAGIAGSVFGRDHLAIYSKFSRGAEAAAQIDYSVGLEYRLYY